MFAKRRRLRRAAARLDPAEALSLGKTLVRSRLPLDDWIQALLDRGTEAEDEATRSDAGIWAGWYRSGHRLKTMTVTTKVVAGDALVLAETERDVETDPGLNQALDAFTKPEKKQ